MKSLLPTDSPFLDIWPATWKDNMNFDQVRICQFRNLAHWKNYCSSVRQREDNNCGISYEKSLEMLLTNTPVIPNDDYEIIKKQVKQVLLKRGLISDTIYKRYEYQVDGTGIIDVARYAAGNPDCVLTPVDPEQSFFYEVYVSISYHSGVENSTVRDNTAKLLATIQLLEQENYFCKVSLVFPDRNCNNGEGKSNLFVVVPVFSHKDIKTIDTMSAVLNQYTLRKKMFALLEDMYEDNLASGYGQPVGLDYTINIGQEFNVETFSTDVIDKIIHPCQSR